MATKKKKKMSKISITIPEDLLKKIDKVRGMISRSPFIVKKLKGVRWGK